MSDFFQQKRFLYIFVGLLLAGVLGLVLFRVLKPGPPVVPPETPGVKGKVGDTGGTGPENGKDGQGTTTPPINGAGVDISNERLVQITDFPVIGPALNKTGDKILFYKKEGGDLFAVPATSTKAVDKIANITVLGLIEATWSPLRDRTTIFYLDGESKKGFLHIGTSTVAALPTGIKSFSWSPDGKSLAYLLRRGSRLELTLADASGKKPRMVFRTPILDAQIHWATKDRIAFQNAPSGLAEGFAYFYSVSAKTFRRVLGPSFGLTTLWAPDGAVVLTSSTDALGKKLVLTLHDAKGKEVMKTHLQTLPEKCVFASAKEVYCAVPRSVSPESIWPDEYLRGEINTSDRVIAIDVTRKLVRDVFDEENFDMSDLAVTQDKTYFFFVNRTDGTLWRIKIK